MRYVTNMLAKPNKIRVTQIKKGAKDVEDGMRLYLENSFVCLNSVKFYNPDVECVLYVSFELSESWKKQFEEARIKIQYVEFGGYKIGDQFDWGIVQFRYDVMKYLVENLENEDLVIMLDTDVVCTGSLENAFSEIEERVCLYDVGHSINHEDRKNILDNHVKLYDNVERSAVIHYGGEFIGAKISRLKSIFEESVKIMKLSENVKDLKNFNDEHITSIAVDNLRAQLAVNNANAYICRYWTSKGFYLASTNYKFNPVALWHMPLEKDRGMLYLYAYYSRNKSFPDKEKLYAWFGLPLAKRSNYLMNIKIQLWLKFIRK